MKALVAGGGVGGLAAAIALALRGHYVQVLERAPDLSEIGAGLQISPNGWRVLQALGVADRLADTLFEPEMIELRMGRSGRRIFRIPIKAISRPRWGAPYIHVHRADLIDALAARLAELAPGSLRTDAEVESYDIEDGVTVRLASGEVLRADSLIGADGLNSTVRRQMLGAQKPRYTGNVAWRTLVPVEALGQHVPPPSACIWAGKSRHAVTTRVRSGTLVNFVGMVERPEPSAEGWRIEGDSAEACADFAGWHPTIAAILDAAPKMYRWALFDRAPLTRWSDGPVALMGDAAHPMMPSMAQGAVQALEDAWILAGELSRAPDVESAFRAYFIGRRERTAMIQRGSAENAQLFHHAGSVKGTLLYASLAVGARVAPGLLNARQDWVYGYDPIEIMPLA